ncbi:putative ribonuclease H-like domain-containing protein [Tanacetum coccineum]
MKKMYCLVVTDDYSRFTWVFFLATKDETSGILKSFITGIENLVDHKVKVIRCDNGTESKNREMNQFCEMKEAVTTACYVQNRVLVVKPHNKTPYEFFHDRTPTSSFMRPFGCPVTILNTIDHLGKFDGKADEDFFVGYSLNSKAFRVFNSRTRIMEENLHIRFSESTHNAIGSRPDWLFDIDALTRTMNYEPIVAGTQSNGFTGTKASDNAGQARKKTKLVKDYILLPLWTADLPFSHNLKSSHDDGFKHDEKKVDEDPRKESACNDQEKEDNVNSTNNVNAADTNKVNVVGGKTSIELPFDPNMPALEDYSIFDFSRDDEYDGAVADMHNLDTTIQVSPNPTTRIHKHHPLDQVIGDLQSTTQTRMMSKKLEEHGFEEPKKIYQMEKRAIGSKWGFKNKNDETGIVIRNKARLVTQGYIQEEGIDYDEVFAPIARIKAIRLFLAYASFKDFVVYQMYVKSAFLYGKIEEEVYVCQPPGFEDPNFPDRVYKVKKAQYGLHQAPRAWFTKLKTTSTPMETQNPPLKEENGEEVNVHMYRSMIGSLMYLTSSRPDIMFPVCACARYQVNPKVSHLYAMKRIFRLDKKSTTGGKGSANPTDPHHTPTIIQPSTQPPKTHKPRKPRKDTQVPQSSDPTENVADEVVHKELGDSLVRVATTASSLEAEQDSGDTIAQTRVLDLEKTKTTQYNEIASMKRRVKKLEKKNSLGEDASKQGRIDAIDAYEEITLVSVQNVDEEMFNVNVLDGEEVFVTEQEVAANKENDEGNVVSSVGDATTVIAATTTTATITTVDDITLAQAFMEIKSTKPKEKGDKGKGILIEPVKPMKKKDLIRLDEEVALKLQAEFNEEERLAREKAKKETEANISLIEI